MKRFRFHSKGRSTSCLLPPPRTVFRVVPSPAASPFLFAFPSPRGSCTTRAAVFARRCVPSHVCSLMNVAHRALLRSVHSNCPPAAARLLPGYFCPLFSSRPRGLIVLSSRRSDIITGWPPVPCLCFRASTICTRPSLEGEQVEQQTAAPPRLWRRRWAGGRFIPALRPGAHLEYFLNVGPCFHRSQDCRRSFS